MAETHSLSNNCYAKTTSFKSLAHCFCFFPFDKEINLCISFTLLLLLPCLCQFFFSNFHTFSIKLHFFRWASSVEYPSYFINICVPKCLYTRPAVCTRPMLFTDNAVCLNLLIFPRGWGLGAPSQTIL